MVYVYFSKHGLHSTQEVGKSLVIVLLVIGAEMALYQFT
jgi:hypothetical protein